MAIITTRVVPRDIDKGVGAEIDRRENVGERGEGMVEIGGGGSIALPLTLTENVIEIEREEGAMGIGGEGSVALLLKNAIETEREEGIVETEEGGSVALLLNLMEDVIETERGKKDLVKIGGEGSVALLLKNAIKTEREEDIVGTEGEGDVALLPSLIETEREKKDLVEIEGEGSIALLPTLTMESVVSDMVKEGGGGAPVVYVDHRIVTGTGGVAGGGGGGGVDLAANDDIQRYVYSGIILCAVHDLYNMML